jgi:5-hydroxyisourate hydrolase
MKRAPITTHILDLVSGTPAAGVKVALFLDGSLLAESETDADGRVERWSSAFDLSDGRYRLKFCVGPWFENLALKSFYEDVEITFLVRGGKEHYHVPLLLSPHGYSTYRGS